MKPERKAKDTKVAQVRERLSAFPGQNEGVEEGCASVRVTVL